MKKLPLFFILFILYTSIFAQENIDNQELMKMIDEEKSSLDNILNEISFVSDLLERKFIIKKYFQEGNLSEIKKIFFKDQKIIDEFYLQGFGEKIKLRNEELKAVYYGIEFCKPYILFNEAKAYYLLNELDKTQRKLEEIVESYKDFELLNDVILMLQEIYFQKGLHKEFIALYLLSNKKAGIQKYWLAHSYYNIGNYEDAKNIFSELKNDRNFGFRSCEMLALISYTTDGVEVAISNFTKLAKEYQSSTEYYSYILLTLARLYIDLGEIEVALQYYDLYVKIHPSEIPDKILLEIGIQNKNNQKYIESISYFNLIINKPVRSEYYVSAKILSTISRQQSGHFEDIESGLSEIISLNDILLETLNAKHGLMDKYKELRNNLSLELEDTEKKQELTDKMGKVENLLINSNETLRNLYSGNDVTSLIMIEGLESEYIYYSLTIDMMNAVVELAKVTPNKRIPKVIDQQIEESYIDILTLNTLSFVGHLPQDQITDEDYELAQTLAIEKIYDEQMIETWYEIEKLANSVDNYLVASLAKQYINLLKENLKSYDIIAKYSFSGLPPSDFRSMIDEEIRSINLNNDNLEKLKLQVIEKFNKKIAERLDKQKEVLVVENENLRNFYDKVLDKVIGEVKTEKNKNEFTLLDILFKQTKALDMEYQVKQSELKEIESQKIQKKIKSE